MFVVGLASAPSESSSRPSMNIAAEIAAPCAFMCSVDFAPCPASNLCFVGTLARDLVPSMLCVAVPVMAANPLRCLLNIDTAHSFRCPELSALMRWSPH